MRLHATIAALTIFLFSPAVWALSLGEAQARSHLNEPLKATITVRAVKNDERDTIRAIIPSADKFRRAGVRRSDIVEKMQVDVADGQAEDELLIHLSTDERIQEPFVNFLVEVRWLGGSVIREYTLLLDPAPVAESRQQDAGSQDVQTSPMSQQQGVPDGWEEDEAPVYAPESGGAGASTTGSSYGPVRPQETLWSIAYSQRPDTSITMDQMQLAIYQANPQAFDGNINQLLKGSMLQIPPAHEIRAIDPDYAKREVARQKNRYQPPAASYDEPAPVSQAAAEPEPQPEPVEAEPAAEEETAAGESLAPEEYAAEDDVAAEPVEESEAETASAAASEPPPRSAEGEVPPEQAAGPATADSQPLTQDELMAEGDEELGTPSVWAEEDVPATAEAGAAQEGEAPAGATDTEPVTGEVDPEPVVDEPPQETGTGLLTALNPVTLALGLVLILILLATYWWYRRRRVVNVGSQFAYAAEGEDEEGQDKAAEDSDTKGEAGGGAGSPTQVWQDSESMPDSIDEYAAAPLQTAESGSEGITPITTVEVEAEDSSPIREMSSEDIDYMGEADVHLAYGLYDEAASVLQRGINENPNRDDLRLKLLEVYHSADQKDDFINAARDWKNTGVKDDKAWQKAVQLGHRIAPESELFEDRDKAQATAASTPETAAPASESQTASLDTSAAKGIETPAAETPAPDTEKPAAESEAGEELEFDLSNFDLGGAGGETVAPDEQSDKPGADESLELPGDLTMEADQTEADKRGQADTTPSEQGEAASLDFDTLDFSSGDEEQAKKQASATEESAAVESAASGAGEASTGQDSSGMEGLDFDLSDIPIDEENEAAPAGEQAAPEPDTRRPGPETESSDALEDALAAISPGEKAEQAGEASSQPDGGAESSASEDIDFGDLDFQDETPEAGQPTPELGEMGEQQPAAPAADEPISDQPEVDNAGDEEVSVKLDLARAYLDMGEPDMARTLLDEVVEMGNDQQRQEAQDLLSRAN